MPCADGLPTLFEAPPHTLAKHALYRRYIQAWFPILVQGGYRQLRIVDGFAGPGSYAAGEPGSPIVALSAVLEHHTGLAALERREAHVQFEFIEECPDRFAYLERTLASIPRPARVHVSTHRGRFSDIFTNILDSLEEQGRGLESALVFIDPFGPTGVPMELIRRIAAYPSCEVLINFAWRSLNQWWLSVPDRYAVVDELYGEGSNWRDGLAITESSRREEFFVTAYRQALARDGWNGVEFRMVNRHNQTEYYLVYGTKHHLGMRVFKDAAHFAAQDGRLQFSDLRDQHSGQYAFLQDVEESTTRRSLADRLFTAHKGQTAVWIEAVHETADLHPTSHSRDFKPVLVAMERSGRITQVRVPGDKPRRSGSFPDRCRIDFSPVDPVLI